ncbi:DUF1833 family protein [Pseudomonas luteola]|uniref:DUF1833 family protein n=1 Tax=Pseudomonas luteola TaxID=47886 RepID=UPI0012390998|nr:MULTISPECIES: DUF1833 family protein [Pseudomonas]MBA1249839.1 DUF1833 family protein [Pseudomonas zeshuii]QEU28851.1 DUF1833 domain-containing protein [Pseudomonas luteola]
MSVLERLYASGGPEVIIDTLELSCPAWDESIYLCRGYEDLVATTEAGATVIFQASGIDIALPKKDNSGDQSLTFAIDNVTGEAQQRIDEALDARASVSLVYRAYVSADLTAPAERPYRMKALGGAMQGTTIQLTAGYYDLLNLAWPRRRYTLAFAPGLRYTAS